MCDARSATYRGTEKHWSLDLGNHYCNSEEPRPSPSTTGRSARAILENDVTRRVLLFHSDEPMLPVVEVECEASCGKMPRRCCVPGCKSNYGSSKEYTNVFSFPNDESLQSKWSKQIHQEGFEPSNSSVVCIKHFSEQFIEREHCATCPDGSELVIPRKVPVLKGGAYPSIFCNQPSYLSTEVPPKQKSPSDRVKEIEARSNLAFSIWSEEDKIGTFANFKHKLNEKVPADWLILSHDPSVHIAETDLSDTPKLSLVVRLDCDLAVTVWHDGNQLFHVGLC